MPHPTKRHRHQKAVYWEFIREGDYGAAEVMAPVEITVRWIAGRKDTLDSRGNVVSIDAVLVVNQDIPIHSEMWLGTMDSWLGTGSAGDDTEVLRVVNFKKVPDLKGRNFYREVELKRKGDNPG